MDYFKLNQDFDTRADGDPGVRHRTGTVSVVNADGTVDLDLGGTVVPGVSVLQGAVVSAGQVVQVLAWAGDLLVLGGTGGGLLAYAEDNTDQTGITSATFAAGTPNCGVAFVAPSSGSIWVTVSGLPVIDLSGNVTRRCELGWELRQGSTIGSGTVVVAATNVRIVGAGIGATSGLSTDVEASHRAPVTGLTPGADYNVRCMHRINVAGSATGLVAWRSIAVETA